MRLKEFLEMFENGTSLSITIDIQTVKFTHHTFKFSLEKYEDKRWMLLMHVINARIKNDGTLCVLVDFKDAEENSHGEPWYIENWYDEDLENALINNDMETTRENIEKLKSQCLHLFDDKTTRNEMLEEAARSMRENIK